MNNSELHHDTYKILCKTDPDLAYQYYRKFNKYLYEKKTYQLWPLKLKWWQDKKLDEVREQFKFLEPILIEIVDRRYRLYHRECLELIHPYNQTDEYGDFFNKHMIIKDDKHRIPALMKKGCKAGIAARAGCSVSTVENYLRALVRIEAMTVCNFGKGRIHYAAGYWTRSIVKGGEWGRKVVPLMNKDMGKRLLDPEQFYLRKKNLDLRS